MIKFTNMAVICGLGLLFSCISYATHNSLDELTERISPIGKISLSTESETTGINDSKQPLDGATVYSTNCFACHDTGVGGAPVIGELDDWTDRIEEGKSALIEHAINGFQGTGGVMPPKGGNPGLSDAEVTAAVEHMLSRLETISPETNANLEEQADSAGLAMKKNTQDDSTAMTDTSISTVGISTYNQVCMVCHLPGIAGAPKLGDKADWDKRIDQGFDVLIDHSLNGYQGDSGVMPAKGGNMSLTEEDVAAAVQYMVDQSR